MKAYIDFNSLLQGEYQRARRYGFTAAYDSSRGANVRTNDFADEQLIVSEHLHPISILYAIIYSARQQNDFVEINLVDFTLPLTIKDIEIVERISLSTLEITSGGITIHLQDKLIYHKEIDPLKSRTSLHPGYLTPDEIEVKISELVPEAPSYEEIAKILEEYEVDLDVVLKEIKDVIGSW